jgi:tetratricopeptide (TPR) repeat protein
MTRNRLMAGEIEAADHYLTLGLAMSERHGHCATCHALLYPVAVSVQLTQGNFAQAEDSCQRLEKAAQEYQSQAWLAMARQARGELAAAQGDFESAMICYDQASQAFKATGNQYDAAHCLMAMAKIRQKRQAPEDLEKAKAEATEARLMLERLVA